MGCLSSSDVDEFTCGRNHQQFERHPLDDDELTQTDRDKDGTPFILCNFADTLPMTVHARILLVRCVVARRFSAALPPRQRNQRQVSSSLISAASRPSLFSFSTNSSSLPAATVSAAATSSASLDAFAALEKRLAATSADDSACYVTGSDSATTPNIDAIAADNEPRSQPREPSSTECCGNGCDRCVWTVYWTELQRWQQSQGDAREPPATNKKE